MNYKRFDVIKFNNGEYLIINVVTIENNIYLYIINNDDDLNDVYIVKVINNNGSFEYISVNNDEEYSLIINSFPVDNNDNTISSINNNAKE